MKLNPSEIRFLYTTPNSGYDQIKTEFLFHSNKIEGSTFSKENLETYLRENIIEGSHKIDDVYETINSVKLFDFVVDTLEEPLSKRLILEYHRMLKANTIDYERGFAGCWKKIPNFITGTNLKLAQPYEVDGLMDNIIDFWEKSDKTFYDLVKFHVEFEKIHPFQDGNGRIGRFIILKQCLENGINLIAIDEQYNKEYKRSLNLAQVHDDFDEIIEIFTKCQNLLDKKLEDIVNAMNYQKANKHLLKM